jgi:ubiquinone/menaquinone biosynthesis C-methylase UbiE
MLRILQEAGAGAEAISTALDFGCAAGRMIRFLPFDPSRSELWGVDIQASHIAWCQQHLSPPFHFATTTTLPHLPFEDNYFDLVYCGSVFTHISDLADAWFLELRRVLKVGGHAYITIHDKHMLHLLLTKYAELPLFRSLVELVRRVDADTKFLTGDFAYVAVGAEPTTQVFYDLRYLVEKWSGLVTVVSVTEEAYGYQAALLLRKDPPARDR